MIIDTHCHLDDDGYDNDLACVLENAKQNGINAFLIPGADINDLKKAARISHANDSVFFAAGVHPYNISDFNLEILREFLTDDRCVAVGECGLDYFRLPEDEAKKESEIRDQKNAFIAQLELAAQLRKPVILHIRDANEDSFNILKRYADRLVGAVLHCFNASPLLLELSKIGNFYFGIGGVLTFKNAKKLVEILPKIPLDRLLIETDAPYLTPHPHRGSRNEPAFCSFVVEKISEILGLSQDEIESITTQNARRLFNCF